MKEAKERKKEVRYKAMMMKIQKEKKMKDCRGKQKATEAKAIGNAN